MTLRIRHLAQVNASTPGFDALPPTAELTFMPLETVWADQRLDTSRVALKADVSSGYVRFQDGDVLVPKTAPTFQHARPVVVNGLRNGIGAGSSELHTLRPKAGTDARFLAYVARSSAFIAEGVTAYQGVAGLQRVPADFVADWPVMPVDQEEQRRIADFLDDQVARLRRAIELRQESIALTQAKNWSTWLNQIAHAGAPSVPLRRVFTELADGPFGSAFTSADYSDTGARVIRLGNIGFAEYRSNDEAFIPLEIWSVFPRCHIRRGDLLIAGLGDERNHAGRACVAPNLAPALVKGKCFRGRVHEQRADPHYLALTLSSPLGADLLAVETRGSTRGMINLEIIRSVALPLPPIDTQRRMVHSFTTVRGEIARLGQLEERSRFLLEERMQALITAAVTGLLDVTTARAVA